MVKKRKLLFTTFALWVCHLTLVRAVEPTNRFSVWNLSFPTNMECIPQPFYCLRKDGKPGREIIVIFGGGKLFNNAEVEVSVDCHKEITRLPTMASGRMNCLVLLPPEAGVKQSSEVTLTLRAGDRSLQQTVTVPAMRHWTVYLFPHSHVDIGYTDPQDIVEFIHKRNLDEGVKLAEATKHYPPGARYCWNPEVTWALERLWQTAPVEQKERVLKAIQDGDLCVDASYVNINTSVCSDEELFQLLRFSRTLKQESRAPVDSFQQMDVPGMSWGLVPVLAQAGVRYVMAWPNTVRSGYTHEMDGRPFWWVGPDGKSKVLFLQPGTYANSGSMDKGRATGRPWFGQRDVDKIPAVIRTGSANVNFTDKLIDLEKRGFPFDFIALSWCLWDNCPLDADLPDAVKAWNEKHAYPHLIIAGGHEIMQAIEKKYGDQLPMVKGDFTEYWTDGLGTAARLTAKNRNARERLVQADTLWTMLHPGKPAPRSAFNEAWRNLILGDEHTWGTENPTEPFFQDAVWKVKESYFREADDLSQTLFDDALAPATDKSDGALGPTDGPADGGVAVFNTQSWKHGGLVTLSSLESARGDRVTDEQGKEVPSQRLTTGELAFLASEVPALGSRHYRIVAGKCSLKHGCNVNGATIENQAVRARIAPATGNITELVDLTTGRNFADTNVDGGLNAFRWLPGNSDTAQHDTNIAVTVVESGPLIAELRISSEAPGCRAVTRSVRLVQGEPWLEIRDVVDKLPLIAKDGIHFGFSFDIPQAITRVDIPWGVLRVEADQWAAANRNWLTMQRWLDISNEKEGVTWCSLDAPLIESGSLTANQTGDWSGERKPWIRKLESSSTIYSWVMNNHWFTNFPLEQDGPVSFRYRILMHGAYDAGIANHFGLEQAQPLAHVMANQDPALKPIVAITNQFISVSILKSSTDGKAFILRLRSVSDKDETAELNWPAGRPQCVSLCRENEAADKTIGDEVTLPANGLVTLRLAFIKE